MLTPGAESVSLSQALGQLSDRPATHTGMYSPELSGGLEFGFYKVPGVVLGTAALRGAQRRVIIGKLDRARVSASGTATDGIPLEVISLSEQEEGAIGVTNVHERRIKPSSLDMLEPEFNLVYQAMIMSVLRQEVPDIPHPTMIFPGHISARAVTEADAQAGDLLQAALGVDLDQRYVTETASEQEVLDGREAASSFYDATQSFYDATAGEKLYGTFPTILAGNLPGVTYAGLCLKGTMQLTRTKSRQEKRVTPAVQPLSILTTVPGPDLDYLYRLHLLEPEPGQDQVFISTDGISVYRRSAAEVPVSLTDHYIDFLAHNEVLPAAEITPYKDLLDDSVRVLSWFQEVVAMPTLGGEHLLDLQNRAVDLLRLSSKYPHMPDQMIMGLQAVLTM